MSNVMKMHNRIDRTAADDRAIILQLCATAYEELARQGGLADAFDVLRDTLFAHGFTAVDLATSMLVIERDSNALLVLLYEEDVYTICNNAIDGWYIKIN